MKKLTILILLICFYIIIVPTIKSSESHVNLESEYKILFDSREFIPFSDHKDLQSKLQLEITEERVKNRLIEKPHLILQFYTEVTPDEKIKLENLGVDLLYSLNNDKTWLASIPFSNINELISGDKIRWIGDILPEDKIQFYILNNVLPEYVVNRDDTLNLEIACFKDVDTERCKQIINKYGQIIEKVGKNSFDVRIDGGSMYKLANEDEIRRIEHTSGPKENDLDQSRIKVGVDIVQTTPYQLDGSNIIVAMWEAQDPQTGGYKVNRTHGDLIGRVSYGDAGDSFSIHATMVADVLAGDGSIKSNYIGMATESNLISYDVIGVRNEHQGAINNEAVISQNSWGDKVNSSNCYEYGDYGLQEEDYDDIVRGDEYGTPITIIFSAGNERDDGDCGLPNNPYNSTNPPHSAKNVISVGATYSDSEEITCFSSFGPTDDGRIKPDVVAPGDEGSCGIADSQGIEIWKNSNSFWRSSGTSLSAPQVSGTASLMYQQFDCLKPYNVETPLPSTIKSLLIHTAKDINTTGPDYASGWGLINATEVIDYIIYRYFREDNLSSSSEVDRFNFTINDSSKSVKVTLVWDDVGGKDSDSDHLINDLDLYLKAPNGTIFKSWTLDKDNPSNPATRDGNHVDNVEQIVVESPGSANLYNNGQWQIIVNATSCAQCPQKYSLIYKRPFLLQLSLNWSLISIPVMPYDTTIGDIVANNSNVRSIYYCNGGLNWSWWFSNGTDTLHTMEPGKGYWIYCNGSTTLEVNGDPITKNSASLTVPIELSHIWNLVGYNSFFEIPTNESLLNNIDFLEYLKSKGAGLVEDYDIYYNNDTFENVEFNLKAGRGAWIKMNSADTWTISQTRSCPSVPATIETFTGEGYATKNQPFTIYGYGVCDQVLDKLNTNVTIKLRVNGDEITNYTMGDKDVDQFRLQVPIGAGVETNDEAEILINDVSITGGNVTVGESGAFYYLNITANVSETTDSDGDGFSCECLDCDDNNASINPNVAEICENNVDDNCNNLVDESCGLDILNLSAIYSNERERIFEFKINNTGASTVNGVSWSLNTGEGTISSTETFNLEGNKAAFVYVHYNYTEDGAYNVNASASCVSLNDYTTASVYVGDLIITNLTDIYTSQTHKIFEFKILNNGNSSITNINWTFDTDDNNVINANQIFSLNTSEEAFVFVGYNYSSTGTYNANATVINGSLKASLDYTFTIS